MSKILILLVSFAFWGGGSLAAAKLKVVATYPDLASLARSVGGDAVEVTSLARGTEDPHFVDPKPSFIKALSQADVLIEGGAELEAGWLPTLVEGSRNRRILGEAPGHILASDGIPLIDRASGPIDRSQGDVHAAGNPHYTLDPLNGVIIAQKLAERFALLLPDRKAYFESNAKGFAAEVESRMRGWKQQLGNKTQERWITYHKSYDYLAKRFGFEVLDQVEPKPGVEPSPTHISALIKKHKSLKVDRLVMEPNRSRKTANAVAAAIGAQLTVMPSMTGDYLGWFEEWISKM